VIKLDSAWHSKEKEEVIRVLQSDKGGLSAEKVELKRREFGYNELKERKKASPLQIFLAQFKNIFVIMLLIAIIISVVLGWYEAQVLHEARVTIETFAPVRLLTRVDLPAFGAPTTAIVAHLVLSLVITPIWVGTRSISMNRLLPRQQAGPTAHGRPPAPPRAWSGPWRAPA